MLYNPISPFVIDIVPIFLKKKYEDLKKIVETLD
jgi:hypothetical protein